MAFKLLCLSWLLLLLPLLLLSLLSSFPELNASATIGVHRTLRNKKKKSQNAATPRRKKPNDWPEPSIVPHASLPSLLTATLTSGADLGMGEYLVDVLVGTPPRHFSLILDTGSDLTWIQCRDSSSDRREPHFDPSSSSSFRHIMCRDPRCALVEQPPDRPKPCDANDHTQTCPYYYFYGDTSNSNTTGDFAAETFSFNLTSPDGRNSELVRVEGLAFGCGRRNRVNFQGASGMLGLGQGPLSFSTQLRHKYGNTFSYCLPDTNAGTSKLVFGPSRELITPGHRSMNFTSFVTKSPNLDATFYYLQIESVSVGGEVLDVPKETWEVAPDGSGGTIIDSGTTLSFFIEPAYKAIKEAFARKVRGYSTVEDETFGLCYREPSGQKPDMPGFGVVFRDGAEWNFPGENAFMRFQSEGVMCLAMLGINRTRFSIIGNYMQRNFHVLYDREQSRLGFAPMSCADV